MVRWSVLSAPDGDRNPTSLANTIVYLILCARRYAKGLSQIFTAVTPVYRHTVCNCERASILQTWRTRCSHVLLFAVKRVVDPSHGPIRGPREIASAIQKAIPTRNRKAIAAQLFLLSGSQNQVGSSISMARTKKGLLRQKSGVTSDFRCLMGHVVQRGLNMGIASHC